MSAGVLGGAGVFVLVFGPSLPFVARARCATSISTSYHVRPHGDGVCVSGDVCECVRVTVHTNGACGGCCPSLWNVEKRESLAKERSVGPNDWWPPSGPTPLFGLPKLSA